MKDFKFHHIQRAPMFTTLFVVFLTAVGVSYFAVQDAVNTTIHNEAVSIAETVANQALTARSVYAKEVGEKTKKDGFGPHVNYKNKPGFTPLPAQFLKAVGLASDKNTADLYRYKLVSKWNIEPTQGLNDEFLSWAWPQLEAQDQKKPKGAIDWQPIYRFEDQNGERVLRYLRADPASAESCASCHNNYETNPQVMARRQALAIPVGKVWKQHQLLGALSVTIPLADIELMAAGQIQETSILIFILLLSSFGTVTWYSLRLAKKESNLAQTEAELRVSEQKRQDTNALLLAKQDMERAFSELSTYMQGIDQHAMVSVTDADGYLLQVNEKFCEISGYTWEEMKGKTHRMFHSGEHNEAFFNALWQTISKGENWRGEICNKTKDGDLYWTDTSIVPLKDDAGQIARYIAIRIDTTERKESENHLRYIGTHDSLTGLPNRTLLMDRIQQAIVHDRRRECRAAVIYIDLDRFKVVNDTLGRHIGDELLIEVARRVKSCVREEDTVARPGGDEFNILLPNIQNAQDAKLVADDLLEILKEPYYIQDQELHLSASIGISIFPDDGDKVGELLKNSDIALYHAKERGRNNCKFYTAEMNEKAEQKHVLISHLRNALLEEEFKLYYQPIVDLKTGKIRSVEALMRWFHPERGMIPPDQFIPLAEETGLIIPIGEWVIEEACDQVNAWLEEGCKVPSIAVNLSARQFAQKDLVEVFERILKEKKVDTKYITLEITEGTLIDNTEVVIERMKALKKMGFKIAVDDFGTGYSSLSYLKLFPIDTLKIDRAFILDTPECQEDIAIVKTIIVLAHSLKMKVIAEGIEKKPQLEFLKDENCDYYQGYYFSKPAPADEITALLKKEEK